MAVVVLHQIAWTWDDLTTRLQYGEIRTTHIETFFGVPDESPTSPSLVTAVNNHGVGDVYLLPGGQLTHASEMQISGGDPEGRVPLLMEATDIDYDGHKDLTLRWGSDGVPAVYLFDTGKMHLRPPTDEEKARLHLPGVGP